MSGAVTTRTSAYAVKPTYKPAGKNVEHRPQTKPTSTPRGVLKKQDKVSQSTSKSQKTVNPVASVAEPKRERPKVTASFAEQPVSKVSSTSTEQIRTLLWGCIRKRRRAEETVRSYEDNWSATSELLGGKKTKKIKDELLLMKCKLALYSLEVNRLETAMRRLGEFPADAVGKSEYEMIAVEAMAKHGEMLRVINNNSKAILEGQKYLSESEVTSCK